MVNSKKAYYSISEVCSLTGLEPHVLRYWESEFSQLRPKKNRAGNRAYRQKDIDVVNYIKFLLYDEKFTIPGAKKKLSETRDIPQTEQLKLDLPETPEPSAVQEHECTPESKPEDKSWEIDQIRSELSSILSMLKS
ncbi:MAG: MerR family transcriptional regulator [Fibrobacter sp.]|nr:MerR family transcriptional regulator [Fibrobacter sp.]